jgi:hypothetical protein
MYGFYVVFVRNHSQDSLLFKEISIFSKITPEYKMLFYSSFFMKNFNTVIILKIITVFYFSFHMGQFSPFFEVLFNNGAFIFIQLSPIVLFNWLLNNGYGFNENLLHNLNHFSLVESLKFYLKLTIIPIIIDSITSWLSYLAIDRIIENYFLIYPSVLIFIFFSGFYFTNKKPLLIKKNQFFEIKNNVSRVSIFVNLVIALILFYSFKMNFFIGFFLVITGIIFIANFMKIQKNKKAIDSII